ncbi:MAG TPA: response regulator transcription factor [Solirubrobacteraceae bacterium]|jgi:DNA-binding NarL/FixJ family response regulator|nr:response regulator transcription factor [Solirubrobacteraceae bacterium]
MAESTEGGRGGVLMRAKPEDDARARHYRLASRTVENEHRGVRPPALSTVSMPSRDDDNKYIAVALGRFDALLGRGLRQILSEDPRLQIVDTDLGNAALERIVAQQAPLVALLDEESVAKPSVLARLRASQPTIEIVVLAHRPARACGMRLLAAGASCLPKDASAADILAAVHIAANGRRVFADVDGHLVERTHPAVSASLTPREVEVLEYLARGQSHGEIAHALQLGVETIRTHSAHIRAKLGVRNKRELIGLTIPRPGPSRQHGNDRSIPRTHQRSPVSGDEQAKWANYCRPQ